MRQANYLQKIGSMNKILSMDFDAISRYFDRLNGDASHFQTTNDICTPMGCVREMVDTIPSELWKRPDLKVLDSCCGNGNFHAYIQKKAPMESLYFNEINSFRIRNVKRIFGGHINLTQRDFLKFGGGSLFGNKYDLIVSNPPYAKFNNGKRASKNHNLSRAFIHKAIDLTKDGGYILFIVPNNWMSYSDRNVLPGLMSRHQFLHLNVHGAKKWFPKVGSSFTWFLLHKVPNEYKFPVENNYWKHDRVEAQLDRNADFIPLYYSETVRHLINKTIYSDSPKYQVETTSDLHRYTKQDLMRKHKDRKYKYRLIHTPSQELWSSVPHKYQNGWKVFISLSDKYRTFIDDCGMTQSVAFVRCRTKREAIKVKGELDHPVYRGINNLTRYGNFNNIRVLQHLPLLKNVSLTRRETELAEYFAGVL